MRADMGLSPENGLLTLDEAQPGEYKVRRILGGRGVVVRLSSLGILPGQRIRLHRNEGHGPLLVEVKGSRFALGRGVCSKILVDGVSCDRK